ncbi:MAG: sugar ABC transporter permease [Hungateiclostridium thermocellum]|nr:sugar ABC transporter permease [Acetivibrio thermocellus]
MGKKRLSRENVAAWTFLLPNLTGFLLISLIPIVASMVLSLTDWKIMGKPTFIGLKNYMELFTRDDRFPQVIWNTVVFIIGTVPVGIALAILVANLLNQRIKGRALFRVLLFIPVVCSTVSAALLWKWLYAKDIGLIAQMLRSVFGIKAPDFLLDTKWAMFSVIVFSIWKALGYNVVIFLAGLQGISPTYYEAAIVDGANTFQKFLKITIPLLTPTIFFVLVTSIISSFQVFDQTFVLTKGGPAGVTSTIVYYLYENGFVWYRMGYASAMAWILFLIIMAVTIVQWKFQGEWVNYD